MQEYDFKQALVYHILFYKRNGEYITLLIVSVNVIIVTGNNRSKKVSMSFDKKVWDQGFGDSESFPKHWSSSIWLDNFFLPMKEYFKPLSWY